jgi:hypothetical protein
MARVSFAGLTAIALASVPAALVRGTGTMRAGSLQGEAADAARPRTRFCSPREFGSE